MSTVVDYINAFFRAVSTVGLTLGSRQRRTTHHTSLISSIFGPSAVISVEYTFFSRSIRLRNLLASLSFPFSPLLCYMCACCVFYLHSFLLSLPTFTLSLATVVIYIRDCPLVSFRNECVCALRWFLFVFFWNNQCWNTFWLFLLLSIIFCPV